MYLFLGHVYTETISAQNGNFSLQIGLLFTRKQQKMITKRHQNSQKRKHSGKWKVKKRNKEERYF